MGRGMGCAVVEAVERRVMMSATIVGIVANDYYDARGQEVRTMLAGRLVYDDRNGDGRMDAKEARAVTDLHGRFALTVATGGTHVVRVVERPGWGAVKGLADWREVYLGTEEGTWATAGMLFTGMTAPIVINVMALYAEDPAVQWETVIRNSFGDANRVLLNSDANVLLRLTSMQAVSYTSTGTTHGDLVHLANLHDGVLDEVAAERDQANADLVVLFAPTSAASSSGEALTFNPYQPNAKDAYSVILHPESQATAAEGELLAHEIGHNLGADHDAANGPKSPIAYARGYRFTGSDGVMYRDVMAYPPGTLLPFYSTPQFSYMGHALGDVKTADDARVIRENAYKVASYRGGIWTAKGATADDLHWVVTAPKTVKAGQRVGVTVQISNAGPVTFSGKVIEDLVLSGDATADGSDVVLKEMTPAVNLGAGKTMRLTEQVTVPKGEGKGTYYIIGMGRGSEGIGAKVRVI